MSGGRNDILGVWAAAWLVIVTINAWAAFYLDAPPSEEAVTGILITEVVYSFLALFVSLLDSTPYDYQRNYTFGFVGGLLGLEAAILILMFYVPPQTRTDPLVISFFVFACSWPGFAWGIL
ncbi:hypothetical protein PG984_005619 [Apiospora sp. TS-2023a]